LTFDPVHFVARCVLKDDVTFRFCSQTTPSIHPSGVACWHNYGPSWSSRGINLPFVEMALIPGLIAAA